MECQKCFLDSAGPKASVECSVGQKIEVVSKSAMLWGIRTSSSPVPITVVIQSAEEAIELFIYEFFLLLSSISFFLMLQAFF